MDLSMPLPTCVLARFLLVLLLLLAVPTGSLAQQRTDAGYQALQAGKSEEAVAAFLEAIRENGKDIRAHVGLGQAYERLGRLTDAEQAYRTAVDLNPLSADLRMALGGCLLDLNRPAEAEREYRRAADLAPMNARAAIGIGESLAAQGLYDDALAAFLRASGYEPDSPDPYLAIARMHAGREHWTLAAEHYRAALRLSPGNRQARIGLISVLNSGRMYAQALQEAEATLRIVPNDLDVQANLAIALDGLGRYDEAVALYQKLLAEAPSAILWGNLGWTQYNAGKYAEAIESSRKALEMDPKLAYVRLNLGLFYAVQNRWEEARREYSAALEVATDADIRSGLQDVLDAMKSRQDVAALAQARQFLEAARKPAR